MNRKTDNELLDDVLAEGAPEKFREAILGETVRVVRRRRRIRQIRNGGGIFVALALAGLFVWQRNSPQRPTAVAPPAIQAAEKSYTLVRTRSLSPNEIVATVSLSAGQFVSSTQAVKIVETTADNFRLIDDNELLALVASHPAILVRTGPQSEKLVFADPKDAKGFPLN